MTTPCKPYILGLDLGVASIGWARVECKPADHFRPVGLLAAGSHLFESGTDGTMADIEKGKDEARNVQRRTARLMRRQTWRRARRKRVLLKLLIRLDLLPQPASLNVTAGGDLRRPLDIDAYMKALDAKITARWVALRAALGHAPDPHADQQRMLYVLREAAAKGPVERHEFGRALYHLAQRRGFLSNRRAPEKKDEKAGDVKAGIDELSKAIEAHAAAGGVPTLGAYLASINPFADHDPSDPTNPAKRRIRHRWTSRKMYEDEFALMWSTQAAAMRLDEAAKNEVYEAVFHQRPLKDQSHLVGRCSLIEGQPRAPKAHRLFQRFRIFKLVNSLRVAEFRGLPRQLNAKERDTLLKRLLQGGDLGFKDAKTLLGLKQNAKFNMSDTDESSLVGHRTDQKLRDALGESFERLSNAELALLVRDLASSMTDSEIRALAQRPRIPGQSFDAQRELSPRDRGWGFTSEQADALSRVGLEEGYAMLSVGAIKRLLPHLESGLSEAEAIKAAGFCASKQHEPLASLPPLDCFCGRCAGDAPWHKMHCGRLLPVSRSLSMIRNPSVIRALTEVRKLVSALIAGHGKPAMIRVELARDLKNPKWKRKQDTKVMEDRRKARAAIVSLIQRKVGIASPKREDIERALLAEECGWICPYTGKQICWETLLGEHPQFDIEHIWPRSRSLDDSFMNKTLCYHEENRSRKRGNTPREAYGGNAARFDEIIGRMRLWKCDPFVKAEKIARFEAKSIPDGFSNRHLSDTRFIARAAADYLGLLYGGRVEAAEKGADDTEGTRRVNVCTGGLTAWLRSGWGIDGLLGDSPEKNRADHRHHAVDAIVIALSDARAVQVLARAAVEADKLGKRRAFEQVDEPWKGFRDQAKAMIDAVIVSHRQSRKVTGPLHDQSIYSRPIGKDGVHRIRKELHKLTVSEIRDGKIVDKRALEAIRAVIKAKLGTDNPTPQNLTKLFTDPANAPLVKGHDGKMVRLRRVRVEADAATPIGADARRKHVQTNNNHHALVVAKLNAKREEQTWEIRPVTLLEAYRRQSAKEPIVNRTVTANECFKFSLAVGEHIELDFKGKRELFRVRSVWEGRVALSRNIDARPGGPGVLFSPRAGGLFKAGARKVHITYLGEVRNAGG